jgi:hypothetical protein
VTIPIRYYSSVSTEKVINHFPTPLSMASGPVYTFALTAPIEFIMGFPDIIRHQTVYVIFIDLTNGNVAVNAS